MKDLISHFGFNTLPFTREIPVSNLFTLPTHEEASKALRQTVEQRSSATILGPAGTGKTVLVRKLRSELPEARYKQNYVKVASLSRRDMCREICATIGVNPVGSFPSLIRQLQDKFLNTSDVEGLRPILIIDEAHEIRADVLGMLKVLTNFDMDSRLVVSIILVGKTSLANLLKRDELEDVTRRMSHCVQLAPLSPAETKQYIKHRTTVAGAKKVPFDSSAVTAIFEIGRGNMRATDQLALKSLAVAFADNAKTADSNHVVEARRLLWP